MLTTYPAVFVREDDGKYSVLFPDLNSATCGDNLNDALEMAQDCMAGLVYTAQKSGEPLPKASDMSQELLQRTCAEMEADPQNAFINLIAVDVEAYARQHFQKSVKKTLSIPQWMNDAAEKQGINFSKVLQEALTEKLAHA